MNSRLASATVSFSVSLLLVGIGSGIRAGIERLRFVFTDLHWILFSTIAGIIGAVYIVAGVFLSTNIGMSLFTMALIAGQILGSLSIDLVGVLGFPHYTLSPLRIVGITITVIAAIIVQVSKLDEVASMTPSTLYRSITGTLFQKKNRSNNHFEYEMRK